MHQDDEQALRELRAENRRLRRAQRVLLAVQEASTQVVSRLDTAEALQAIVDRALAVVKGDSAAIFLLSADQQHLEPQATAGDFLAGSPISAARVPTASPAWQALCRSGGLIIADAERSAYLAPYRQQVRHSRTRSVVAVPLAARGRIIGALAVTDKRRKRAFGTLHLRFLRLFATQAALALDNNRLYREARDASARTRAQLELGKAIFDAIRDPAVLLDAQDRIVAGNRALFAALGRSRPQVLGQHWARFVDPGDARLISERINAAGGRVVTALVHVVRPDGSRIPLMVTAGETRDPAGQLIGTAAVGVDFEQQQRIERRLVEREKVFGAMRRLTAVIGKIPDVRQVASRLLDSITGLLGVKAGVIYLIEDGDFVLAASRGMGASYLSRGQRMPVQGTVSSRAAISNKPLVLSDLRRSPRLAPALRAALPATVRSAAIIPIPGQERVIGVIALGHRDTTPFSAEAINALRILAAHFGAAVEGVRLYEATRRRAERLAALNQVAEQLIKCSDARELVGIICHGLARVLDARRVLCLDYDTQEGSVVPLRGHGIGARRVRLLKPAPLGDAPLLVRAASERQPLLCARVRAGKDLPRHYCQVLGLSSVVAVPVIGRSELCGFLLADNAGEPIALGPDERDMALALANQAAMTLDNVFLLQEERSRAQQLSLAVQEAHHRIKNNLQALCDLLELEAMQPDGAAAIEKSVQRVRAISLVHEFLSRHHDVATVEVSQVLERLVPLVVESNRRQDQRIAAAVRAAPLTLNAKKTTAVALIVNELVSNAVRHGLDNGKHGTVKVDLREARGVVHLRVADNGKGLPEGFDPALHQHVGLEIARVLAERDLEGTIALKRRSGRGTVARVRFRK